LAVTIYTLVWTQHAPKPAPATETAPDGTPIAVTAAGPSPWKRFLKWATDAVPVEKESAIDMGHDYDGIRELDNNLPPWWKYGFYLSIVFGVVYLIHFHVSDSLFKPIIGPGSSSAEEYAMAMEEAAVEKAAYLERAANDVNENNMVASLEADVLATGATIYQTNCQVCHGAKGEGGIGPNLTDAYWLHGGDVKDVFRTIKYGVPEKGMISWQSQLKPKEMAAVTSYLMTMVGTTPPNPKDPQGEKYVPEEAPVAEADSVSIAAVH
ncbi:MAG: cbb3-type cytochrome c oxidase N-terminal domain-containing protein, partial [Bacteroidota bacterium]